MMYFKYLREWRRLDEDPLERSDYNARSEWRTNLRREKRSGGPNGYFPGRKVALRQSGDWYHAENRIYPYQRLSETVGTVLRRHL